MSVDFDAPENAPAPAPVETPAPVAAAPEPPPPPADPDEADAVELPAGKHVPLEALKAARAEARAAKEQASRLPALEHQLAQMQGSLATFQQLQQAASQPRPVAPPAPGEDPDLVGLARSLDYINPQTGQPDLDRAAGLSAIIQRQAEKIARQMVSPLQEQSARAQADMNFQTASRMQSPTGVKASDATLRWMWQNLPANYTADPRVAQALPALALGLEMLAGTNQKVGTMMAVPPPGAPPLHTEGAGGGTVRRAAPISQAERDIIAARGMKEDTYLKHTKDFVKGRPVSLDED